jgi:hypothetical protein
VSGPLLGAARDPAKWAAVLRKLGDVHPPSRLTRYGVEGSRQPATALEWYRGLPDIQPSAPPGPGTRALDAFLTLLLESLSEFRLVGSWPKPSATFAEMRLPGALRSKAEQAEYRLWAKSLWGSRGQPKGFEFLGRATQHAAVVLPPQLEKLVAEERSTGFFRRFSTDLVDSEWRGLGPDLKALVPFCELASARGLALYYREDGT